MARIFADSNRARMRYIAESDTNWGTLPTSGSTREIRYTGSTINASKTTTTSEEIRADRMVSDIIETSAKSDGSLNIEFSAGSHDDFLQGFMYGAWTQPMTFDTITGTALAVASTSTITISSATDYSKYFINGRRIRLDGFLNVNNCDYFTISGSPTFTGGVTTITVSGTPLTVEAGNFNSFLSDANDVIILKSTAIRCGTSGASTFDDNGAGTTFSAAITAGALTVGQNVHIDGLGYATGNIVFSAGTPAAPTTVVVSDGINTVTFQFGGTAIAGAIQVTPSATAATNATNLVAAINNQRVLGNLQVAAKLSTATVLMKNLNDAAAGSISKTGDGGTLLAVTTFTGNNAGANGIYTLTSVAGGVLGVTSPLGVAVPTVANTTIAVTIKGSMLRNPSTAATIIPHSFSLETGFEDVSQYFVTNGQRVAQFSYDIASGAILKGSFDFQGSTMSRSTATVLGQAGTYTSGVFGTTSTPVMNATVDVGALSIAGTTVSTALQSISLKGTNNLREQMAVANKFPAGIGAGRMEITGSVVAYFADGSNWDRFINHSTVSLSFNVTDDYSNRYIFTLPALIFDTDTVNPSGLNTDIMENLSFTAKRDAATSCMIQIDRFSDVDPAASF